MRTDFSSNPLIQKCIAFSLSIVNYVAVLEDKRKFNIANQLLLSATSIGACSMEAQSAESKADFIHKLKIADKEAYETWYWLTICREAEDYPFQEELLPQLEEIMKLLNAIIHSSKNKLSNSGNTLPH